MIVKFGRLGKKGLMGIAAVLIVAATASCSLFANNSGYSRTKLEALNEYLKGFYFGDLNETEQQEAIYSGFVDMLGNAATYYLDENAYKMQQAESRGETIGTGVHIKWGYEGTYLVVTDILEGSPAEDEDIKLGDRIIEVEGVKVNQTNQIEISTNFHDISKDNIKCVVEDKVSGQERIVYLANGTFKLNDIEASVIDNVLYLKVSNILEGTSEHIKNELEAYNDTKGIILDFRAVTSNNIEEAAKIADLFVREGELFKVVGKDNEEKVYSADGECIEKDLAVLVDTSTAMSAEAVVSALEEKATILGRQTAGYGWVNRLASLEDGTGIMVATGRIISSTGEDLSEQPIVPDKTLYYSENEMIDLIDTGMVTVEDDSTLAEALKLFQ